MARIALRICEPWGLHDREAPPPWSAGFARPRNPMGPDGSGGPIGFLGLACLLYTSPSPRDRSLS
eukprot:7133039-Pyramimonas_sp.AAC.1